MRKLTVTYSLRPIKALTLTIVVSIRLSANLYSEHLLDRGHYLDSVLTSFESSNFDTIPIWILVLQIVWKDLVEYRKYGRRLVEALLEKLHMVSLRCLPVTVVDVDKGC